MQIIKDLLNGAVIGVANIIPGVSGGTMLLVLGIYERLIKAIHNISFETVKAGMGIFRFKRDSFSLFMDELEKIDAFFLLRIVFGAAAAIFALAKLMTYLLNNLHDPTYGFFFGLVLLSIIAPYKLIRKKTIPVIIAAILAVAAVVSVSEYVTSGDKLIKKEQVKQEREIKKQAGTATPHSDTKVEKQDQSQVFYFLYIFFLGAISISAMILPGVSGSLLLLVMGGYFDILAALDSWNIPVIAVFIMGCLVGILLFSRILAFLLNRWHDQTMGFLTGLVIGSLWMIWPFKTTQLVGTKTVYLRNTMPDAFGSSELLTVVTIITGMIIVAIFLWMDARREGAGE